MVQVVSRGRPEVEVPPEVQEEAGSLPQPQVLLETDSHQQQHPCIHLHLRLQQIHLRSHSHYHERLLHLVRCTSNVLEVGTDTQTEVKDFKFMGIWFSSYVFICVVECYQHWMVRYIVSTSRRSVWPT